MAASIGIDMLTRNEAERLAQAMSALRPDWPIASLMTFIGKRKNRPLLDLTIELAWVAQLPDTKSPARIDEDGPWKSAVRGAEPINTSSLLPRIDFGDACHECLQPRAGHTGDHEWQKPQRVPMPDSVRKQLKRKKAKA